jgi:hypothetical protein
MNGVCQNICQEGDVAIPDPSAGFNCCPALRVCGTGASATCCVDRICVNGVCQPCPGCPSDCPEGEICTCDTCCTFARACGFDPGLDRCCPLGTTCVPSPGVCCPNAQLCGSQCCQTGQTCVDGVSQG